MRTGAAALAFTQRKMPAFLRFAEFAHGRFGRVE